MAHPIIINKTTDTLHKQTSHIKQAQQSPGQTPSLARNWEGRGLLPPSKLLKLGDVDPGEPPPQAEYL